MLKPDAAQKQLNQWLFNSDEDDTDQLTERHVPAVKKLPKKLRDVGLSLLGRNADGEDNFDGWDERHAFHQKQTHGFDKLSQRDQMRILKPLFGPLAEHVRGGWQWMKAMPYSRGYMRTPFRAASSDLTLEGRGEWLRSMVQLASAFHTDVLTPGWLAAWVPYIRTGWTSYEDEVSLLLASVIDAGGSDGDEVFGILCQSARREHEIGAMGRHVTGGLLSASRREGWELMEKMLLAAQRQEGLRQSILNAVVTAHPEAFRRMLQLIVDEKLSRFSSVVQATDNWLGLAWASAGGQKVNDTLAALGELLQKPAARKQALAGDDAERAYLALWATAFDDALASIKPAEKLLGHQTAEIRYVAALHLARLGLPQTQAARAKALDDEDLRVALCALSGPVGADEDFEPAELEKSSAVFEALERLLVRMPAKPTKLKPIVWPWTGQKAERGDVSGALIESLGELPPTRLIPHLKMCDTYDRSNVVRCLAEQKKWDAQTRDTIVGLVGDAAQDVRETAIEALKKQKINAADAESLEPLLTRTAADLRTGVVSLILSLADKQALASAARLLESKDKNQRLAGLELLRQLAEANRERAACMEQAAAWRDACKKVLKAEQSQLDAILESDREVVTLDNALGLLDPTARSPVVPPKKHKVQCVTAATPKIISAIDALIHEHRADTVRYKPWGRGREEEEPLGEIGYRFPSPQFDKPVSKQVANLPLREVWEEWFQKRPAGLKDKDGCELLRCLLYVRLDEYDRDDFKDWSKKSAQRKAVGEFVTGTAKPPKLKYDSIVRDIIQWLLVLHPPKNAVGFLLDAVETIHATIPQADLDILRTVADEDTFDDDRNDWRPIDAISNWRSAASQFMGMPEQKVTRADQARYWQMLRWLEEPVPGAVRQRPDASDLIAAYNNQHATLADVADHLLGPRERGRWGYSFDLLRDLTQRSCRGEIGEFIARPEIAELLDNGVARILEIELARGESVTAVTDAALSVSAYRGVETLERLLRGLGKGGFKKMSNWRSRAHDSRPATLTEMIEKVFPADSDTPEQFAAVMRRAIDDGEFDEQRLLQLAFLAPQWTDHVQAAVGWDGLAEGLYWFMAHMKYVWGLEEALADDGDPDNEDDLDDDADTDDDEYEKPKKLSRWERLIQERTALTAEERADGAIDVAWFQRTWEQLKPQRWEALASAARFAATSAQAKRAQFIADVLLGKASKSELVAGIRKKNLKENVRLLGLLPLDKGAGRDKDIAARYEVLQGYRSYANKLSSMSKPDALRACDIGLRNLATTAGFEDPMRLQWAMEAESTKDLAKGPIVVEKAGVSLTLALNEQAEPELTVRRGDKVLKSLPSAVNKEKRFVELRERNTQLKRQASRVKGSLEAAMCRGDSFTGGELGQLAGHAILWPQLARLVLCGEGILGYPDKGGKALRDFAGKLEPVKKNEQFRIAHPIDLLETGVWDKWQHECFTAERLQPFKQIFRELYVVTQQEKRDKTRSNRYAGQQVNPRQAYALWGHRGWSVDEYDNVWKPFHAEGLNVSVSFNFGITTPLEVEGLTIESVHFHRRDDFKPLGLTEVPPRLFSEVMRDMDLIVSVAHAGEVDPEASASTVEMRATLLRETCQLLGLKNVKLKDSRASIRGQLGEYTVHLGSGVVHRLPGGSVCIVPVHSQHRGRLFLPFADDDPRTAEVISKTLLLARDNEIDDPIILEQLRRGDG